MSQRRLPVNPGATKLRREGGRKEGGILRAGRASKRLAPDASAAGREERA
jgi:hypothetical protein